jgi:hypothetical protein
LTVADSKIAYQYGGLAILELAVGAFSRLANDKFNPLISVSGETDDPPAHACYRHACRKFPITCGKNELETIADTLANALDMAGAKVAHLESAVLFEPSLNRRFAAGLNKNQALLKETGRHLRRLAERFANHPLLVMVDKQGGRNDYLPLLSEIFPGVWLDTLIAGDAISRYRLRREGTPIEICFQAKADQDAFCVSLASMAAKYVRERYIAGLNAWFGRRIPGIRPTAGYPLDAARWLADVASAGSSWNLESLLRER